MLKFNGKVMKFGNVWGAAGSVIPPEPVIIVPSDMDFIYFANSFDGSKIPNSAPNSTFGDYLKQGSLTLNGSGSAAYLTNGLSSSNYLYKDLTEAERTAMKAVYNTYTFFIRVMQDQSGVGGIISWRSDINSKIYMIRAFNGQLELYTTQGYDCGSDFSLNTDRVYKVVVFGSSFKAYNLDNNAEYSLAYSNTRWMQNRMASFNADLTSTSTMEAKLSRFYALAGIPRATTAEEDANIKTALMNQSIAV